MSLRQRLLEEKEKKGFISITKLEELVTPSSLQELLPFSPPPLELQKFVHSARKLFAVLVLAELERFLYTIIYQGITDSIFSTADLNVPTFLDNSEERRRFLKEQWTIPPVLSGERHLELPLGTVLPFLQKKFVDHGTFGMVYKVRIAEGHLQHLGYATTTDLALKVIGVENEEKWDIVMREVVTLRRRCHPNLVPLLASFTECTIESSVETKFINMLFPYAEMDMEKWLYLPNPPALLACQSPQEQRLYLYPAMYNLVSALAALHREVEGLIASHHDLKPKNILVINGKLVIADLGTSELVHVSVEGGSGVDGIRRFGTRSYYPPEYYGEDNSDTRGKRMFGRAFDMWAMGCIMVQVAILIVWGWESGKVEKFRKDREEFILQNAGQGSRDRNKSRNDDSFLMSIPVVDDWLAQLQEDGSATLQGYLATVVQMLRENPLERICSWEAELNLYELLYPDESKEARFAKTAALVQGPPSFKDLNGVETPIHRAAQKGNLIQAINMMEAGWPADLKDSMGYTPIELAERGGHLQLRDILLQANMIKECGWKSALKGVIPTSVIQAREQCGFRLRQEALWQVPDTRYCQKGGRGSHLNPSEAGVTLATLEGPQDLKRRQNYGRTSMHNAAQRGDLVTLKFLLGFADAKEVVLLTDDFGQTPLHCASNTSAEAVSLILKATSDLKRLLMAEDQNGRTPLHIAAAENPRAVEALLKRCPNKSDIRRILQHEDGEGMTPSNVASEKDQVEVKLMLDKALADSI